MVTFLNRANSETCDDNEALDAVIVQAARHDSSAFVPLYRRYVNPVYRYLYSRVGNSDDAEDLTSQVFIEALTGLASYREQGRFAAWLFTIARRRLIDHYRQFPPQQPLSRVINQSAADPSPLGQVAHNEALTHLASLVAHLDDDKQELLRLRFAADLTYAEIGRLVGRSEAATKMAIHRLLRQLEESWEVDHA